MTPLISGPSHHVRLSTCALTGCSSYETPLYNLTVDQEVNRELLGTGEFEVMSLEVDEDEHSMEMHMPFIAKVQRLFKFIFSVIFSSLEIVLMSAWFQKRLIVLKHQQ